MLALFGQHSSLTSDSLTDDVSGTNLLRQHACLTRRSASLLYNLERNAAFRNQIYFLEARHGFLVKDNGCCWSKEGAGLLEPDAGLFGRKNGLFGRDGGCPEEKDDVLSEIDDGLVEQVEVCSDGNTGFFGSLGGIIGLFAADF